MRLRNYLFMLAFIGIAITVFSVISDDAQATPTFNYKVTGTHLYDSDGVTDHAGSPFSSVTVALNHALSHANTVTYVPAGTYTLIANVYFAAGTTLIGDGDSTIFTATPVPSRGTPTAWYFYINGVNDVTMSNFKFTGYTAVYGTMSGGTVSGWTFNHITAQSLTSQVEAGFWLKTGNNAYIKNVLFTDCQVLNSASYGFLLHGNGYYAVGMFENVAFINCKAIGCGYASLGQVNDWAVGFDIAEDTLVRNVTLIACEASNNWYSGFHFEYEAPETNVWLIDCIANNNGLKPTAPADWGYGFRFRTDHIPNMITIKGATGVGNHAGLSPVSTSATTLTTTLSATPAYMPTVSGYHIWKTGTVTYAHNDLTSNIDYSGTSSAAVIQYAINHADGKTVIIENGTYEINSKLITYSASLRGVGNTTILKAVEPLSDALIGVYGDYVDISQMQIDGNAAAFHDGDVLRMIEFVDADNGTVSRCYIHDVRAGQGVYMSNAHYCTINNTQIYNVGRIEWNNYGSGIAFGEESATKIASSYVTIEDCIISNASMSSIDLEPAHHITITGNTFVNGSHWLSHTTPVITAYARPGWAATDYITVTYNRMDGAFGEFFIMTPSNYSLCGWNTLTYTEDNDLVPIYASNSHGCFIVNNTVNVIGMDGIVLVDCSSMYTNYNRMNSTGTIGNTAIKAYHLNTASLYNVFRGNVIDNFTGGIYSIHDADYAIIEHNIIVNTANEIITTGTHNTLLDNDNNVLPDEDPIVVPDPDDPPIEDPDVPPYVPPVSSSPLTADMLMLITFILLTIGFCGMTKHISGDWTFDISKAMLGFVAIIAVMVYTGALEAWALMLPILYIVVMVFSTYRDRSGY